MGKRETRRIARIFRRRLAPLALLFSAAPALAYVDEGTPPVVKFSAYKPTYFVVGKYEGKGQISFKARPAEAIPFYLAYTQLMMWDIYKSSAPMRDINFNPDLFYRFQLGPDENLSWIDFGPFEHESNGLNGNGSRSWNRTYVRYSDVTHFENERRLQWSVKLFAPYGCEGGCARYRGIAEVNVSLENPFGASFGENDVSLRAYPGGPSTLNPAKGGQELTLRMRPSRKTYLPLIVVQLFHGYGENLLDQDKNVVALRGGIGF